MTREEFEREELEEFMKSMRGPEPIAKVAPELPPINITLVVPPEAIKILIEPGSKTVQTRIIRDEKTGKMVGTKAEIVPQ